MTPAPLLAGELVSGDRPPARERPGSPVEILFVVFRGFAGPGKGLTRGAGLRESGDESAYHDGKTCHHL